MSGEIVTTAVVMQRAMKAYHYDAEFHAIVEMAVRVVDADQRERMGLPLAEAQRDTIRLGAMVAQYIRNHPEQYGLSGGSDTPSE